MTVVRLLWEQVDWVRLPAARQMVNNKTYKCPECGLVYSEKEWAEKCEAWCKEHKSCNLEIAAHRIPEEKIEKEID